MAKTFEDLRAFQRALDLMVDVYTVTEHFPKTELYGLTTQLRRASCSVVSKIAEGQGQLTYGEWWQHLGEARGSLHEVQAQVIAAHKLRFLELSVVEHLKKRARLATVELQGLIDWVRRRELQTRRKSGLQSQTASAEEPASITERCRPGG